MKTPARHSLSALIAATAVLGLPAANAWAAATASPSATPTKTKAAATKAAAAKAAAARKAAAAKAAAAKRAAPAAARRTIVGTTSDMRWGPVTVTIVVKGSRIVDASADLPVHTARSEYINSRVGPYLRQQLLATQSGTVEMITGATMTCESYAQSLQGALDKAGIKTAAASFSGHSTSRGTGA